MPTVEVDLVVKPSKSSIIVVVGLTVIIIIGVIVAAYIGATAYTKPPPTSNTVVFVVSSSGTTITSTPFSNAYIRSVSGYWIDNTKGAVGFSAQPQQLWSFDGMFLTNQTTLNSLYVNNGVPALGLLPPSNVSRPQYVWAWNGTNLIVGNNATNTQRTVVNDTGTLTLLQVNGPVPGSATLVLSQ